MIFLYLFLMNAFLIPLATSNAEIEEVNDRQLEKLIAENDFVAVAWYTKTCKTCEAVLAGLESVDDITDKYNIEFVKVNNKKYARSIGIRQFPAVTFFKAGAMMTYPGDTMDSQAVINFLTSEEALELPDKIEEVDAENLERILGEEEFVAVLFYEEKRRESMKALQHVEMIDDEADKFAIRFVRINDYELAEDYSLRSLPALAFFRHNTPILYTGDLNNQEEVFEFLFQNKHTADEDFSLEDVDEEKLEILINLIDFVVVLFYKDDDELSVKAIEAVDSIDDNLKERSVSVVKTSNQEQIEQYDIEVLPKLIYFESEIPTFWPDNQPLDNNDTILAWVERCQDLDLIEEITEDMLEKLIANTDQLAVFFYDKKESEKMFEAVLEGLENIDDELDTFELPFVKISSRNIASDFGFEQVPALAFFQKGIPSVCDVDLMDEGQVLKWILIEAEYWVEPPIIDQIFLIENRKEETEWAVEKVPQLILFEEDALHVYPGNLSDTQNIINWIHEYYEVVDEGSGEEGSGDDLEDQLDEQ